MKKKIKKLKNGSETHTFHHPTQFQTVYQLKMKRTQSTMQKKNQEKQRQNEAAAHTFNLIIIM